MEHRASEQNNVADDRTNFAQDFFTEIEPIALIDPLASTLGVVAEGDLIFYHYREIVKFAERLCLAVSGAFMTTKIALKNLYKSEIPVRGEIKVKFKGNAELNVNGPISQVVSFITGAAGKAGFKGFGGKFSHYQLLSFDDNTTPEKGVTAEAEFERIDAGKRITISYRPNLIPKDPTMGKIMESVLNGKATREEKLRFGNLRRNGVKRVLTDLSEGVFELTETGGN